MPLLQGGWGTSQSPADLATDQAFTDAFAPSSITAISGHIDGWSPGSTVAVNTLAYSPGRRDILRRNTAGTTRPNWDATERTAWTIVQRGSGALKVRDFGAVGDGVTDDSAAFIACRTALAATQRATSFGTTSNNVGLASMIVDPGEYLVTQPEAVLQGIGGAKMNGWACSGAGADVTRIRFHPADPGADGSAALLNNQDKYSTIYFSGITFACTVANATFMTSRSNAVANYQFDRCRWEGSWRYGLHLTGTNTNSEIAFYKCYMSGNFTAFLYIPDPTQASDQFLDYDFVQCSAFLLTGNLVDIESGGNVNIWGGSYTLGNSAATAEQSLLALRGGDHGSGVMRALVTGARIELKHPLAKAIYCEWKGGNIDFISVDMGALTYLQPPTNVTAEFNQAQGPGPNVNFLGCSLPGQHKYHVSNNSFNWTRRVSYRNCDIAQWPHAADFILTANEGTVFNRGSSLPVIFESCRSNVADSHKYPIDCVLNWQNTNGAVTRERVLNFQDSFGVPVSGGSATVTLPLNAVITRVVFDRPAGAGYSGTTWAYNIADADGASVHTYSPSTAWNAGFHGEQAMFQRLSTDNKRTITLTATGITANDVNAKFVTCLVYYVA